MERIVTLNLLMIFLYPPDFYFKKVGKNYPIMRSQKNQPYTFVRFLSFLGTMILIPRYVEIDCSNSNSQWQEKYNIISNLILVCLCYFIIK